MANPTAGSGRAARLMPTVRGLLAAKADVLKVAPEQLPGLALDAVVVLGGDGTVHRCLPHLALGDVPLGIVPAGSGDDLAAALGLPDDPVAATRAVLDAMTARNVRRIDLGRAEVDGREALFATVLCAGFDARVGARAARLRRIRGRRRYDIALAAETARLRPHHYRLATDGLPAEDLDATLVSVCNTSRYGGGSLIAPHADPSDGWLDVCVVAPVGRRELVRMAPAVRRGEHVGHAAVSFRRAREVSLDGRHVVLADGEPVGGLPVRVRCEPAALPVLVPPGPGGAD